MAEEPGVLQAQTEIALRDLASLNARKRRDAVYFMGETANVDAVATLIDLYKNDKNAGVRRAAGYALGQFRAVDLAMGRGEQAKVEALLRAVEVEGQIGRRAPTASRLRLILALILSLALMGILFLFQNDLAGAILGGRTDRTALLRDVRGYFTRVTDDTHTLQAEYLNVLGAQSLGCVAFFNAMPPYMLDRRDAAAYRDISAVVADINQINSLIAQARTPYDAACAGDPASLRAQQASEIYRTLIPIFEKDGLLERVELALTAAEANTTPPTRIPPTAVPPTAAPPSDLPPTTAPTSAPTAESAGQAAPTAAPAANFDSNTVLPPLYDAVDAMIGSRGAATLLVQYWEDVGATGTTAGCDVPTLPEIPANVELDPAVLAASTELARAVDLLNNGLSAIRDGWVDFRFACNSRTLMGELPSKLATARAAQSAFGAARTLLDAVRDPSLLLTPTAGA